jgi:hypothetical protein
VFLIRIRFALDKDLGGVKSAEVERENVAKRQIIHYKVNLVFKNIRINCLNARVGIVPAESNGYIVSVTCRKQNLKRLHRFLYLPLIKKLKQFYRSRYVQKKIVYIVLVTLKLKRSHRSRY